MAINSVASTPTASASGGIATPADSVTADMQDRFLTLLVAQVNSQDPMNPMDNAQMTSQMAQINTVNGIQQLNQTVTGLVSQFSTMQVLQGTSLVGHNVLLPGSSLTPDGQTGLAGGAFDLAGKADTAKVEIRSGSGQLLESINLGSLPEGRHSFTWDPTNYPGHSDASFKITATRGAQAVTTTLLTQDRVVSVGSLNGAMSIQLQSGKVASYADIAAIQ